MENASKALIIAGAILLSILIIGLGMFIYQQAAGVMEDIDLSELEVKKHNDGFEIYAGENVSGTMVRSLIKDIESNNRTNAEDESLQIEIISDNITDLSYKRGEEVPAGTLSTKIKTGKTYTVTFNYEKKSNYINGCTISEN